MHLSRQLSNMHRQNPNMAGYNGAPDYSNQRRSASATYHGGSYGHPTPHGHAQEPRSHYQADNMNSMNQAFGSMSVSNSQRVGSHVPAYSEQQQYGGMSMSPMPVMQGSQSMNYGPNLTPASSVGPGSVYGQMGPPFMPASGYAAGYVQQGTVSSNWGSRVPSDATHTTMPPLTTPRRGSFGSTAEDHMPGTPYVQYPGYPNNFAVMDRSPMNGGYANSTTPSPSQYMPGYMGKPYAIAPISDKIQSLLKMEPPIPSAIPAPSSPVKPLDRCLENKNGETNVYIRGLLPETTDEMLQGWGKRFGDIQSSKSIIDHKTGTCKGFGFIKYHNFDDAEECIRGFHHLGYEVSFARESFYSKLKKFADETNTNLYVSNIPRNFNEHELSNVFGPYKVLSSRILRDDRGNGRGVGFARFESRDVCEQVINDYNNTVVAKPGGEEHTIQIRYSDTHEQKSLKQQTAAARSFRAAEFEYGCSQALRAGILPPQSAERMQSIASPTSMAPLGNEFEAYMQQGYMPQQAMMAPMRRPITYQHAGLPTIKSENSFKADNVHSPATPGSTADDGAALVSETRASSPGSGNSNSVHKISPAKTE
ncbi:hypothetical protein BT63DRAFT_476973 [Microthyrium microscopicum]|uniref:RRM domain-containing protein n=1 Tax=Microthyrium microscopicum TaxID=703497 RepID=A0A6A6UKX6_9PEZI|nr:hypothetical protein BT63DRAFT_476973 [Microthyrium microscopicum]